MKKNTLGKIHQDQTMTFSIGGTLMRTKKMALRLLVTLSLILLPPLMGQTILPFHAFSLGADNNSLHLIAKEEEVNQFFDRYANYYKKKDIEGFLSLFSSKAIQNRKDAMGEIRRIYTDFFNQSDELRYRLNGKMEIYQNAVEVKGRYEIDQLTKKGYRKVWTGEIKWILIREKGELKIISLDYQPDPSQ